jgi:hypothetical protein
MSVSNRLFCIASVTDIMLILQMAYMIPLPGSLRFIQYWSESWGLENG